MIDPCSLEAKPLLSVDEAVAKIKESIQPVKESETVPLHSAFGRILSKDMVSPIDLPYQRNSAMDGYALSSKEMVISKPFSLKLVGTSWAGKPYQDTLQAGQCIRIFTGAVVPEGADSVVIQEQVKVDGDAILFPENLVAHQNIREAGEEIKQGGVICPKQKTITAADVGLLAASGIQEIPVWRKLNVAYFSTGDELVGLSQPLQPGKIYDSNRYALAGLLAKPCYKAIDMGVIPDNKALLEEAVMKAANTSDLIISTGGASVGDADYIMEILAKLGEVKFWKIAIKPGKPLAFGKIGDCYYFGLPGNPVSLMVTFQKIVLPALMQAAGAVAGQSLRVQATCTTHLKKAAGRQEFQRGILSQDENGRFFVASTGNQGSHILSSMSHSNCFIVLPAENKGVKPGETVTVEPFGVFL